MRIRNQADFLSGLLFLALGGAFAIGALAYRVGSAQNMGPGYFPFWIGVFLAGIGVTIAAQSLTSTKLAKVFVEAWEVRAAVLVLLAAVLFGLLIRPLGLVLTLTAITVVSALAGPNFGWRTVAISLLAILMIGVVIFAYLLGSQLPIWPDLSA